MASRDYFPTKYPAYMIYSRFSCKKIREKLAEKGSASEIYGLKVGLDHDGKETNRTIAILGPSFDGIEKNEFTYDFKVVKFNIVKRDDDNHSLCVTIHHTLKVTGEQVNQQLVEKMSTFVDAGLLDPTDFKITVPLKSRDLDLPANYCYIAFDQKIDLELVTIVRCFLHQTYWEVEGMEEDVMFYIFSARPREPRAEGPRFKKGFLKPQFEKHGEASTVSVSLDGVSMSDMVDLVERVSAAGDEMI